VLAYATLVAVSVDLSAGLYFRLLLFSLLLGTAATLFDVVVT
jgi:hypothetical protein